MDISEQRALLRKQLREARRSLSDLEQDDAAKAISLRLLSIEEIKNSATCGFYFSNDGEVSLDVFFAEASNHNETPLNFTLPVLHPFSKGHLLFLTYNHNTTMVNNRFGIEEPALDCRYVVAPHELDVVLMPLVGFDSQGNRLGMGGGFYDRTFANLKHWPSQPRLIGIAHDCQKVDSLPVESWDVPLDAIVTPTQIIQTSE